MHHIAVIQFPGSNCERETHMALARAGLKPSDVLWNSQADLSQFDGFVIVGGFSYEDRCRSGLIASKDPLLVALTAQAEQGKPVLGICNGAQILVESGLVPGVKVSGAYQVAAALTTNHRVKDGQVVGVGYYNAWCDIAPTSLAGQGVFDSAVNAAMCVPIAHAEGRFVLTPEILAELKNSGAALWQYQGDNPNGSVEKLAAISNPAGNVLAMMPHPERTPAGDPIFQSMKAYLDDNHPVQVELLNVDVPKLTIDTYQAGNCDFFVKMVITDNEAVSLQKALHKLGLAVKVNKMRYWSVDAEMSREKLIPALQATYELFNPNKEYLVKDIADAHSVTFLVQDKADTLGQHKRDTLCHQHRLPVQQVRSGKVWQIVVEPGHDIDNIRQQLIDQNIVFNSFAHDVQEIAA